MSTFGLLIEPLTEAAARFKKAHGRPLVLVVDSADRLAQDDPRFFAMLQDFAKDCDDFRNLRMVFVSSDGSAFRLLKWRSAWTRAGCPCEVGEISDDLAVEYLTTRGVPGDQAKLAVATLTGGLVGALDSFATASSEGITVQQATAERDSALEKRLLAVGISRSHALFRRLVEHTRVGTPYPLECGLESAHIDRLLAHRILAAHPDETYSFHDSHTAGWFGRELKKWSWWPGL
jgi:hypothetical protein